MPGELTPNLLKFAQEPVADAKAINLLNIQGDVLIGLQKMVEAFVFFEIKDVHQYKGTLRTKLTHLITRTEDVRSREFQLRDLKTQGHGSIMLPLLGFNIAFSATGIQKLIPSADLGDLSFSQGAASKAGSIGDRVEPNTSTPLEWLPAFLAHNIDGVMLFTAGTIPDLNKQIESIMAIAGNLIGVIHREDGAVRPGLQKGHEHFGWQDGISQPGVEGLVDPFPGQRSIKAGRFVFGYEPSQTPSLPWMADGSFMVFRRLKQLVPELNSFLADEAKVLATDSELLGARLVGRWKSGAPLALAPFQDDPLIGTAPTLNNNFDNSGDQNQRRCPFGAHIRKTNPREDFGPGQQPVDVDPHRIIRAGIPYGPELSEAEASSGMSSQDRGLLFVCYQTSIINQFEFLQSSWVNNPDFIFGKSHPDGSPVQVGFDPIIGVPPANHDVGMNEPISNFPGGTQRSQLSRTPIVVIPTGGGYFFSPSISALANELSA